MMGSLGGLFAAHRAQTQDVSQQSVTAPCVPVSPRLLDSPHGIYRDHRDSRCKLALILSSRFGRGEHLLKLFSPVVRTNCGRR